MTSKMPKRAFQIIFGVMMLAFVVPACNNNKSDKKEPATDTASKMNGPMDTTKMDTAQQRPTAPGNGPN